MLLPFEAFPNRRRVREGVMKVVDYIEVKSKGVLGSYHELS